MRSICKLLKTYRKSRCLAGLAMVPITGYAEVIPVTSNARLLPACRLHEAIPFNRQKRVFQYQSGETSPKARLMDQTISGLLGVHFLNECNRLISSID